MENINATNITARINVIEPVPNVDINYGPYDSTVIAQQTLNQYGVWDENAIGLTVGVWKDSTNKRQVTEYQLIKNNSGNLELTVKQSEVTPGTTDYSALTGKPSINGHVLSSGNNALDSIGAASASALSTHTGDSKIHVPMTYGGTATAITGFKIEGEKMTITVGSSEYSFRLTEWHDIPDYYVLFGVAQATDLQSTQFQVKINGEFKGWGDITGSDLLSLAQNQAETNGYSFATTKTTATVEHGTVSCNYVEEISSSSDFNVFFILYRTSSIDFTYLVGDLGDDVIKNSNDPNGDFNDYMTKNNGVQINGNTYYLKTYYTSQGLGGTKLVIKFN